MMLLKELLGTLIIAVIASVFYLNVTGSITAIEFLGLWAFTAISSSLADDLVKIGGRQ